MTCLTRRRFAGGEADNCVTIENSKSVPEIHADQRASRRFALVPPVLGRRYLDADQGIRASSCEISTSARVGLREEITRGSSGTNALPLLFDCTGASLRVEGLSRVLAMRDRRADEQPHAHLCVIGAFSLSSSEGRDLSPSGQKARALLALLATADRGVRSRGWLCDKLWSDREAEQAFANLRQTLTQLRKRLGSWSDILEADRFDVRLRLDLVDVDLLAIRAGMASVSDWSAWNYGEAEFLEGIDVRDPEFEDWLAVERSRWADLRDSLVLPDPPKLQPEALPALPPIAIFPALPGIAVAAPVIFGNDPGAERLGTVATEMLCRTLHEMRQVDVFDHRDRRDPAPARIGSDNPASVCVPYTLRTRVRRADDRFLIELAIIETVTGKIECMSSAWTRPGGRFADDPQLLGIINQVADALYSFFGAREAEYRNQPSALARVLVLSAVDDLFDIGRERLMRAENRIRQSLGLRADSQTYAWLAFASTFKVGQKHAPLDAGGLEEVEYWARRALELDPNNSLSLTLCAHVFSYVFHDRSYATDLFVKALKINPDRPLTWDLFSVLHAYVGRPEAGLKCAQWAKHISPFSPYAYYFDASCCISASLAGHHQEALEYGRRALSSRPNFNPVLRFMVSSLGHLGRAQEAQPLLGRLMQLDPKFSLEAVASEHHAEMPSDQRNEFTRGFKRAGLSALAI